MSMQTQTKVTSIWKNPFTLTQIHQFTRNTLVENLGIEFTEIGDDYLVGTMPADHRTKQPRGIVHGGASVALAESLGSIAGAMAASAHQQCFGLEINANHITKVTEGLVTGVARPFHIGRSTQVWEIKMTNDAGKLTCVSRITLAVVDA
jgi:1,4-dihydroxy-2-naphthoyl-CoA hydrolase